MNTKCLEDIAGYALGVLDATEQAQAEQHLVNCHHCRDEAAQTVEALHATLGQAVTLAQPSPLLRTQLLARVALEMGPDQARTLPGRPAIPVAPAVVLQDRPSAKAASPATLPIWRTRWVTAVAAVPTALALFFGVMALNMKHQIDDVHTHILAEAFVNMPHMTKPLGGQATRQGMRGEIILPQQGTSSLLILAGMPVPAAGMDYRCWVHMDGHWIHTRQLQPDASGMAMMVFDHGMDLHNADDLGITLEPQAQAPAAPQQPDAAQHEPLSRHPLLEIPYKKGCHKLLDVR